MLKVSLHVNFGRINKYIFRKDFRKNASENKANTNDGTIYADKNHPNRPDSSGTRVVPISATPPPAISCFIPN